MESTQKGKRARKYPVNGGECCGRPRQQRMNGGKMSGNKNIFNYKLLLWLNKILNYEAK